MIRLVRAVPNIGPDAVSIVPIDEHPVLCIWLMLRVVVLKGRTKNIVLLLVFHYIIRLKTIDHV